MFEKLIENICVGAWGFGNKHEYLESKHGIVDYGWWRH